MKTKMLLPLVTAAVLLPFVGEQLFAAEAQEVWEKNCAACHGKDGKGETKMGKKAGCKDYTDAKVQAAFTDEQIVKAIKEGVKAGDKEKMKSFAEKVSDDEAKALVAYVRVFKK
jgi:mono/diheme cytochrome c family protein